MEVIIKTRKSHYEKMDHYGLGLHKRRLETNIQLNGVLKMKERDQYIKLVEWSEEDQ